MTLKALKKKLFRSRAFLRVVSHLVHALLWLIYLSNKRQMNIAPESALYAAGEQNAIYCFWHGRLLMQPFIVPRGRLMRVLISQHRDGEIITQIIKRFGVKTARGSRGKATTAALRDMQAYVQHGDNLGITPDGPRGPRHEAAMGAVWLAKTTGLPIIPVTMSASKAKIFSSWDRFLLPKPFGRLYYQVAAPLYVSTDADDTAMEQARSQLQNILNDITQQADAACDLQVA